MQTLPLPFRHPRLLGLGLILLMALSVAACSASPTPASSAFSDPNDPADALPLPDLAPELVAQGQELYLQNCASCHGAQGEGQPNWKEKQADGTYPAPPHNADGHTWHHGDGTLFKYIKGGGAGMDIPNFKSNMPAFENTLTDEEIIAIMTYLKSLWPEKERRIQYEATLNDPIR